MVRLLQLIALLLLLRHLFRVVVRWLGSRERPSVDGRSSRADQPIYRGKMVRDPVCGVFVPVETSVEGRRDGKTVYFCSENCRNAAQTAKVSAH